MWSSTIVLLSNVSEVQCYWMTLLGTGCRRTVLSSFDRGRRRPVSIVSATCRGRSNCFHSGLHGNSYCLPNISSRADSADNRTFSQINNACCISMLLNLLIMLLVLILLSLHLPLVWEFKKNVNLTVSCHSTIQQCQPHISKHIQPIDNWRFSVSAEYFL